MFHSGLFRFIPDILGFYSGYSSPLCLLVNQRDHHIFWLGSQIPKNVNSILGARIIFATKDNMWHNCTFASHMDDVYEISSWEVVYKKFHKSKAATFLTQDCKALMMTPLYTTKKKQQNFSLIKHFVPDIPVYSGIFRNGMFTTGLVPFWVKTQTANQTRRLLL